MIPLSLCGARVRLFSVCIVYIVIVFRIDADSQYGLHVSKLPDWDGPE
jgi:hypothetical protein